MTVYSNIKDSLRKRSTDSVLRNPNLKKGMDTEQRTFYLAVFAIVLSGASFALVGLKEPSSSFGHMVVVDMNQLLRKSAADIVNQQADKDGGSLTELKLAEHAKRIRVTIEEYAAKHQVIVITKGAVFGANVKEVTDDISALL